MAGQEKRIRIFLLDDHDIVRRGLREAIGDETDIEVVGEAGTAKDALEAIDKDPPDVAVLDVRLPDGSGIEVCREVRSRHPQVRCLMLTSFSDDQPLFDAILAGASGYVLKETKLPELIDSIRRLAKGESLLDPSLVDRVMKKLRGGPVEEVDHPRLTVQEQKILELIGVGMSNREIAERLSLAEQTIKNYVSTLLAKLGLERRTQAAVYAAKKSSRP